MTLQGKVAIVTGAGRGIGRAVAIALAREQADVVVNYLASEAGALATVEDVELYGSRAVAIRADVSSATAVASLVRQTIEEFGRIDILVNNAAIYRTARLPDVTEALWNRVVGVNLKGTFLCIQEVAPYMLAQNSGAIVNIASGGGLGPHPGYPMAAPYAAAKAGVIQLTRTLARELAPDVRVNCVAPGVVDSKDQPMSDDVVRKFSCLAPLRRVGKPSEVAEAVLFLASDAACFITGQTLSVDGGVIMP